LTQAQWRDEFFGRIVFYPQTRSVQLTQTPVVSIEKVLADGVEIDPSYWTLDNLSGMLWLSQCPFDIPTLFSVEYTAGWEPLPLDLQQALNTAAETLTTNAPPPPPGVRSFSMPDVGDIQYFDQSAIMSGSSLLPALAPFSDLLKFYRDTGRLYPAPALKNSTMLPGP
jgi:hypothetical protein